MPLFISSKEYRLINEFPAFVKETVERVYPLIPATATAPEMPATLARAFSRQLIAYIAPFLPTAPYFKFNDGRISTVCDDQYSSTLSMLEETADEAFKVYMTRKTQGWFRRWGCASPCPCAAPDGAGSGVQGQLRLGLRRQRVSRHWQRRTTRDGGGLRREIECGLREKGYQPERDRMSD
jgi:hypothetical protein